MKKVKILNELDNRRFEGAFEDDSKMQAWINEQKENDSWGKKERWNFNNEDMPKRVLETREAKNDYGEKFIEYKIKADYVIEIIDLEQNYDYLLEECYQKRRAEYPSADEIYEALMEKLGENKDEKFLQLVQKRAEIKQKYPKPVKPS